MENYEFEFNFEAKHLENIISIAKEQLNNLRQSSDQKRSDIIDAKKELHENTNHSISGLWSMEKFHELASLSQYVNPLSSKMSLLESETSRILALERMTQSPYFARIDFRFENEEDLESIYIGRASLMNEKTSQIYVYDWRSPISSVFYRFGVGKAFYEAPTGKITGDVSLKRQFEINHEVLEYFFDADVQIMDEFLRKLLSQNASPKMKTIVETIQKDQDLIIRDMENSLMMVQGVAGSGKTSVALHRAAYLMYQGLSSRLSANNIMIISPNTLFEQYISNVLPELGEDNIVSVTFEEMLKTILPQIQIQNKNRLFESIVGSLEREKSGLIKQSMEFKASPQFKEILERFIYDIPRKWIGFTDIWYDGKCIFSRFMLKAEILSGKRLVPLCIRLSQLEEAIFEKVHELRKGRMKKLRDFIKSYREHIFEIDEYARLLSIIESTALVQKIHKFTQPDIFYLYALLFGDIKYFKALSSGIELPNNIDDILKFTKDNLNKECLSYADSLALAFFQLKLKGFRSSKSIKQVVIDEAQDYYPLHFEILKLLVPHTQYTILGDIYQTIEKSEDLSFFEQISQILAKEKATLITMNKSFRCTAEILNFSKKFLQPEAEIESFSRKGEKPEIYSAGNLEKLEQLIIKEIEICREAKYQSIALLCKTEKAAASLHCRLKGVFDISLIGSDTLTDINGIFILPIYMAKGLEFDAVLICDVDHKNYFTEDDKKLLYIGCTRALHRLNLFHTGEMSNLLNN